MTMSDQKPENKIVTIAKFIGVCIGAVYGIVTALTS